MKKVLALVLTLVLFLSVVGTAMAAGKVGIAMPTQSLQRWNLDGANLKALLEADGYEVDLQYANNEVATQVSQLETMILNGAELLVVASIDGSALGTVLETAKDAGIVIIAYDRLLTATEYVDYYITFDNYKVGTIQGTFLKETFDLDNATGPLNMEIFCGDPGDNNAGLFFQGAIDVLQPYIDSGVIVVPSGQTAFEQCATADWDSANAQARMDNLIAGYYTGDTKLDMVLCSNDSTAPGRDQQLESCRLHPGQLPGHHRSGLRPCQHHQHAGRLPVNVRMERPVRAWRCVQRFDRQDHQLRCRRGTARYQLRVLERHLLGSQLQLRARICQCGQL